MKSSPSDLFAGLSLRAKTKLVVLGSSQSYFGGEIPGVSSLNFIEHVSLASLLRPEISLPRSARLAAKDPAALALLRKWFWSRKPDAGFVLWDFPATLLQALVFDEWLEARQESLDAVLLGEGVGTPPGLVEHYRNHGLLAEAGSLALTA